jgi:aminopeptidase N
LIVIVAVLFALKGSICSDFQLPKDVRPSKYRLKLQTSIHDGTRQFSAEVKIHISVTQNVTEIVLHLAELNVTSIGIFDADELEQIEGSVTHTLDTDRKIIRISTPQLIKDNDYVLDIIYTGELHEDFIGFYENNEDPPTKTYFTSIVFKPTKFRYFCPSFDQMDFRSIFEIEVKHHDSYRAISNTEKITQPEEDNFITTKFLPTKSLPTTSIAIVVSNFKSISMSDSQKIDIFGRHQFIDADYLRAALKMSFDGIKIFQDYFKPAYDMNSLKLVIQPDIVSDMTTFELIIFNQYNLMNQPFAMTTTHIDKMVHRITRTFAVSSGLLF